MIWSPTNVSRVFLAALALVIMLSIDVVVTLGVVVPLAAVAALSRMANARVTAYRWTSRQTAGEVSAALGEILAAVQAIKVAAAEQRVVGHLSRLGQARRRSAIGEQLFTSIHLAAWSGAAAVGTGIILLLAASSLRAGHFTVGDLALFITYLQFLADFVALFAMLLVRLRRAEVAWDRVAALVRGSEQALVKRPPAEPSLAAPPVRFGILQARGLTYRHTPGGPGIAAVDLTLPSGTVTVVTGRVGAGKTTLLRTLLGLLPMETGSIHWNGKPVSDPATFRCRPDAHTCRRRRTCSAPPFSRTSCWGSTRTARRLPRRSNALCSSPTWRRWPRGWGRSSVRVASASRAARCRGSPSPRLRTAARPPARRRPVQRPRCRHGAAALGARIQRSRRNRAGCFAPSGRTAACRPGGRAEGWSRRGSGHSQQAASLQ